MDLLYHIFPKMQVLFFSCGGLFLTKKHILPFLGLLAAVAALWLGLRYALPAAAPFLLGAAVALGAEPLVNLMHRKARLPRWAATGIGVPAVLLALGAVSVLLTALLVRQAGNLTRVLPDITDAAGRGISAARLWLTEISARAPETVQPMLTKAVDALFSGSGAAMQKVADTVVQLASGLLTRLPGSLLSISTGVLAAFMISVRLPGLKAAAAAALPLRFRQEYLPALRELKRSVLGWLVAQLKLSAVTAVLLGLGFWALRISYWPVWALLVAFVDALPVLGTGAVLIPWSVLCFLQGQTVRGLGLLGIYAIVWLMRSVLEPRLVGRQLGLDPLVTLIAMYAGFRFFGIPGMLLAPLAAVCGIRLVGIFRQQGEK